MLRQPETELADHHTWLELKTIYDEAPIGLAVIDTEFRFRRINAMLAEINGVPAEAHIGKTIREIVPAAGDFGEDIVRRIVAEGKAIRNIEIEAETSAQPGVLRSFVEHWTPIKDQDGAVVAVNVVVEETTERKAYERTIDESSKRLSSALRIGKLGVFEQTLAPPSTRYWDRIARRIAGIPSNQEVTDELFWDLVHPEDIEAVKALRVGIESRTAPRQVEAEYRIVRLIDKSVRWVNVSIETVVENDKPYKILGIVRDVTDAKLTIEREKLLSQEVNHRAKNLLAVVQAIASQTSRNDKSADEFAQEFTSRLLSLARSHDLVVRNDWKGINIAELVSSQLFHFKSLVGDRILMTGTQILVSPRAAQDRGMAINELVTNAAKYGALSNSDGCVLIGWDVVASRSKFQMSWIEFDGPAVSPPAKTGFGTRVITRMLESSLDAAVTLEFQETGLQWRLEAPASSVVST